MLGIISAMPKEIDCVLNVMKLTTEFTFGNRKFYKGLLFNKPVVIAFSNWGKVAATTTATQMINSFNLKKLIFTGVAGALQPHINIGDVIVGTHLYQHDMDARPLFKQFEIPITNKIAFKTNLPLTNKLFKAATLFLTGITNNSNRLKDFNILDPKVYKSGIASGDQFISSDAKINQLNTALPNALCVEMEGAAIAQVCYDYQINFGIIRTISDNSKHHASVNFKQFVDKIAGYYALGILKKLLN